MTDALVLTGTLIAYKVVKTKCYFENNSDYYGAYKQVLFNVYCC